LSRARYYMCVQHFALRVSLPTSTFTLVRRFFSVLLCFHRATSTIQASKTTSDSVHDVEGDIDDLKSHVPTNNSNSDNDNFILLSHRAEISSRMVPSKLSDTKTSNSATVNNVSLTTCQTTLMKISTTAEKLNHSENTVGDELPGRRGRRLLVDLNADIDSDTVSLRAVSENNGELDNFLKFDDDQWRRQLDLTAMSIGGSGYSTLNTIKYRPRLT
jgi:hypothetical protein